MDWISFLGGILVGVFIGAAGQYYAQLFTDRRQEKEARTSRRREFQKVREKLPKLIAEMQADFANPENRHVRKIYILTNRGVTLNVNVPTLTYFATDHENLTGQFSILENYGYLFDVTTGNVKKYQMTEEFVELLMRERS